MWTKNDLWLCAFRFALLPIWRSDFFTVKILFESLNTPWLYQLLSQYVGWFCRGRDPEISPSASRQQSASSSQSCKVVALEEVILKRPQQSVPLPAYTHKHSYSTRHNPKAYDPTVYPSLPTAKELKAIRHHNTDTQCGCRRLQLTMTRISITHLMTGFSHCSHWQTHWVNISVMTTERPNSDLFCAGPLYKGQEYLPQADTWP